MPRMTLHLRTALPWFAIALLTSACGAEATGECTGTHAGERVNWPIDGESTRLVGATLHLDYLPEGSAGLTAFGAEVRLSNRGFAEEDAPRTVQLVRELERLSPEETSLVVGWDGMVGMRNGFGTGYPEASGVPASGTLTLDVLDSDHAEGRFVYRYEDGNELTCTFNAPTPAAAGDISDDDEDDDD